MIFKAGSSRIISSSSSAICRMPPSTIFIHINPQERLLHIGVYTQAPRYTIKTNYIESMLKHNEKNTTLLPPRKKQKRNRISIALFVGRDYGAKKHWFLAQCFLTDGYFLRVILCISMFTFYSAYKRRPAPKTESASPLTGRVFSANDEEFEKQY